MGHVFTSIEIFTLVKQRKAEFASTINKVVNSIDCSENQDLNSLALFIKHSSSYLDDTHILALIPNDGTNKYCSTLDSSCALKQISFL